MVLKSFNHNNNTKTETVIKQIIIECQASDDYPRKPVNTENSLQPYCRKDLYLNKNVSDIDHSTSDTFYTNQYLKTLSNKLGSPKSFLSKTAYERKLIQSEIENMSEDDYSLKTYLHRSVNEANSFNIIFPVEFETFTQSVKKVRSYEHPGQRGYMMSPVYKYKQLISGVSKILVNHGLEVNQLFELEDADIQCIFNDYLTPKIIFDRLTSIFLKIARDRLFKQNKQHFNTKSLHVYQHEAFSRSIDHLIQISVIDALVYKSTKNNSLKPLDAIVRQAKGIILSNKYMLRSVREVELYIDHLKTLFDCYVTSGIFVDQFKTKEDGKKTYIKYFLPNELSSFLGKYTVPPRVFKQDLVTNSNMDRFIIPTLSAKMKITSGTELIKSINIANSKRFTINKSFCIILDMLDKLDHKHTRKLSLPITDSKEIDSIKDKIISLDIKSDRINHLIVNKLQNSILNKRLILKTPSQFRFATDVTVAETRINGTLYQLKESLGEKKLIRKSGITRLTLAKKLVGFPLYYSNTLCSTTRCFAKEHLLSRHVGCLKLLRSEFTPTKVTIKGLTYMLRAYYCDDSELLSKFEQFVRSEPQLSKASIQQFYYRNRVHYSNKDSLTHFMLLSSEIQKVFKTNKTSILLQLDQVASGLVFMSLLFNNVSLGSNCNLIPNSNNCCVYTLARDNFLEFYENNIEAKDPRVLELFTVDRKLHKYALMCYSYRQTSFGRTQDFVERYEIVYLSRPNSREWESIHEISQKYDKYIDSLFPGLDSQIKILDQIIELVAENSKSLRVRSIEGDLIEWSFYKSKSSIRKSLNPNTLETKSYRLRGLSLDDNKNPIPDIGQFKKKFLSYLVHSVDASIMRELIRLMYHDHRYKVDQLFDCVMIHPNQVDNVYSSLNKIYRSTNLHKFMQENVFETFIESVSTDKQSELQELIDRFLQLNDKDFISKLNVNVKFMYTFES